MTATPETKTGRIVLAGRAVISEGTTPVPWSPPTLTPGPSPEPLAMVLPQPGIQEPQTPKPSEPEPSQQARRAISPDDTLEDIAAYRPADLACAMRTVVVRTEDENEAHQKIAGLLLGLGPNLAAHVLRECTDAEAEAASRALINLKGVTARETDAICEEFRQILVNGDYMLSAGRDYARDLLRKAFSFSKAQMLLNQASGQTTSGFAMLENVQAEHIVPFIAKEHPQTIALILSQLSPAKAAGVISRLAEDLQFNVAVSMAQMENISPQSLYELESSLADELQAIISGQITEIGGPKPVAEMLNHVGPTTEKHMLERFDALDPELAEEVRNQMFVFDDIARLTDREIQMVLREVDTKDLAIALKGGSEKLQKRIFANLSEEMIGKIKEEMQYSGPVRMSDVEEIQLRIVQTVRQLEEKGQITVVRDTTDIFI